MRKLLFTPACSIVFLFLHLPPSAVTAQVTSGYPIRQTWMGTDVFVLETVQSKFMFYSYDGKLLDKISDTTKEKSVLKSTLAKYNVPGVYEKYLQYETGFIGNGRIMISEGGNKIYDYSKNLKRINKIVYNYKAGVGLAAGYEGLFMFKGNTDNRPDEVDIPKSIRNYFFNLTDIVKFSPDARYIFSSQEGGEAYNHKDGGAVYDLQRDKLLWKDKLKDPTNENPPVTFSADGKYVAITSYSKIVVLDINSGETVKTIDKLPELLKRKEDATLYTMIPCPDMSTYLYAPRTLPAGWASFMYNQRIYLVRENGNYHLLQDEGEKSDSISYAAFVEYGKAKQQATALAGKPSASASPEQKAFNDAIEELEREKRRLETDAESLGSTIRHNKSKYCCLIRISDMIDRYKSLINKHEQIRKKYDKEISGTEMEESFTRRLNNLRNEMNILSSL